MLAVKLKKCVGRICPNTFVRNVGGRTELKVKSHQVRFLQPQLNFFSMLFGEKLSI
jgi:hypothetical protein